MPPYRLAIFDFDGTLVDSFDWFLGVLNHVARRHGFREVDGSETEALRGLGVRELLKELRVPFWKVPAITREMRALKLEAADRLSLFEGTREMLGELDRRGVTIAMVSSDSEQSIRRTLGPETSALVSHLNCSASLFGKAPKIRQVLKAAGVPQREAIYIGDETRDAVAARKAGVGFGAAPWGYTTPIVLAACAPDVLFESVADIARIAG